MAVTKSAKFALNRMDRSQPPGWQVYTEENWQRLEDIFFLSGSGPPTQVAGNFLGQTYYDGFNRIRYVCVNAGTLAQTVWAVDDGLPVGTLIDMLNAKSIPPGWLACNGQQVLANSYPRLALALAGTGLISVQGTNTIITLPNLVTPTTLIHENVDAQVGVAAGTNGVAAGGGFTPAGTVSVSVAAGGAHDHGGVTGSLNIGKNVPSGSGDTAALHPHTHAIPSQAAHTHTATGAFSGTPVSAHSHTLSLRTLKVRKMIKAF